MVLELVDFSLHAPPTEKLLQRVQRHELNQRAGQKDHAGAAERHGGHGQRVQILRIDRTHFAVADGEHRQRHHVERVLKVPSRPHIAGRRGDPDDRHEGRAADQIARRMKQRIVHRGIKTRSRRLAPIGGSAIISTGFPG